MPHLATAVLAGECRRSVRLLPVRWPHGLRPEKFSDHDPVHNQNRGCGGLPVKLFQERIAILAHVVIAACLPRNCPRVDCSGQE